MNTATGDPVAQAVRKYDAIPFTHRAAVEGWPQPVWLSRQLYEMVDNPPRRGDDVDSRLGELFRLIAWEYKLPLEKDRDFLIHMPTKGRTSKYIDLTLHAVGGHVIITVKGEGVTVSAYDHEHA